MMPSWNWWSSPQADEEAPLHYERLGSSIVANTRGIHELKNKEGPEEGQPDGQENEAEEDESREGRSIMR